MNTLLRYWRILANCLGRLSQRARSMHQLCPLAKFIFIQIRIFDCWRISYVVFHQVTPPITDHWWTDPYFPWAKCPIVHRCPKFIFILLVRDLRPHLFIRSVYYVKCNMEWSTRRIYSNSVDFNTFMGDRKQQMCKFIFISPSRWNLRIASKMHILFNIHGRSCAG